MYVYFSSAVHKLCAFPCNDNWYLEKIEYSNFANVVKSNYLSWLTQEIKENQTQKYSIFYQKFKSWEKYTLQRRKIR